MRLGIKVSFTARAHPLANGKHERFNGTIRAKLLRFEKFAVPSGCQERFRSWYERYRDCERPDEALDMDVPASRYEVSERSYPEELPPVQ